MDLEYNLKEVVVCGLEMVEVLSQMESDFAVVKGILMRIELWAMMARMHWVPGVQIYWHDVLICV